jgi:hypothetical protein
VKITSQSIIHHGIPHQTAIRFSVPIAPDDFLQLRDKLDSAGTTVSSP